MTEEAIDELVDAGVDIGVTALSGVAAIAIASYGLKTICKGLDDAL